MDFIKQAQERVLQHQEEQALLKAYIAEWRKFFTQCGYLPMPFGQLETALQVRLTIFLCTIKANVCKDSVVANKIKTCISVIKNLLLLFKESYLVANTSFALQYESHNILS